ncbi:MAG: C-GCAxxG-C-C family protein [Phycisphaerae bacterium]
MSKARLAEQTFRDGGNCAQAVLTAFCPDCGLEPETATRAAQALGGGIAGTGRVCGALTGAVIAIGLARGSNVCGDKEAKADTNALVRELLERFTRAHGDTACRTLIGLDLTDPAQAARAYRGSEYTERCAAFVNLAADLTEELLAEPD